MGPGTESSSESVWVGLIAEWVPWLFVFVVLWILFYFCMSRVKRANERAAAAEARVAELQAKLEQDSMGPPQETQRDQPDPLQSR
jgi:flagellar biosynthesis/type III secretory pathway M-ring protein FliF/YscJ